MSINRALIEKRFTILKMEKGKYHAFPTIIRLKDQLWLACRSGLVSGRQDHGVQGKLLLFSSDATHPDDLDVSQNAIRILTGNFGQ